MGNDSNDRTYLDSETLDRIRAAGQLTRTVSEEIRDRYFDRIMTFLFDSEYRGQIRFLSTTELDAYITRQYVEDSHEQVRHLIAPNEEELDAVTCRQSEATLINLYFPL